MILKSQVEWALHCCAILAGLPVAVVYLIFQRKVTEAIMLSAGIKG